jgi:hypothetical protein
MHIKIYLMLLKVAPNKTLFASKVKSTYRAANHLLGSSFVLQKSVYSGFNAL